MTASPGSPWHCDDGSRHVHDPEGFRGPAHDGRRHREATANQGTPSFRVRLKIDLDRFDFRLGLRSLALSEL